MNPIQQLIVNKQSTYPNIPRKDAEVLFGNNSIVVPDKRNEEQTMKLYIDIR